MAKKITALLLAAAMLFCFSGCEFFDKLYDMHINNGKNNSSSSSEPESAPEPMEVDPNFPVTVFGTEISAEPQKVAAASPALAEYIDDLGLFERLCASCDFSVVAAGASLPSVGSPALPDFEAIKAAAPEYILTLAPYDEASLTKLQQMNVTVLVLKAPQSLDEAAYSGEKASALFLRGMDNLVITGDSLGGELLSRCFANAAGEAEGFEILTDDISAIKPDIIFVGGTVRLKDLESSDLYRKKSAVKNDRVFLADLDALSTASLRSFSVLRDMMATAYDDYTAGTKLEVAYPSIYQ